MAELVTASGRTHLAEDRPRDPGPGIDANVCVCMSWREEGARGLSRAGGLSGCRCRAQTGMDDVRRAMYVCMYVCMMMRDCTVYGVRHSMFGSGQGE